MLKYKTVCYGLTALFFVILHVNPACSQTPSSSEASWPALSSSPPPAQSVTAAVPVQSQPAAAPVSPAMAALQRTVAKKQYLFIFFNNGQNEHTDAMWAVFHAALTQMAGRAEGVPVNISDPLEQELVHRFDVSRAPMPLVLVLAPNGAIMGGFPSKFDEAQLMGSFGTPAMEETLRGLQERKLVLLCIQSQSTQQNEAAMYGVNELRADPQIGSAVHIVNVDPANPNEGKLFSQLQVDPTLNVAQTVMLVPPGSPVGKFMGGTTKTMLLSKLQSSGSCGPGGSCPGGKCGPGGCGPAAGPQPATAQQPQQQSAMKRFFSKVMGR